MIFMVFCCASARLGNNKKGPSPAANVPAAVALMKSRRVIPSLFFLAMLVCLLRGTGTRRSSIQLRNDTAMARQLHSHSGNLLLAGILGLPQGASQRAGSAAKGSADGLRAVGNAWV